MIVGVNIMKLVAVRTRELRLKHALTQQELAELADISEKNVQKIETGQKKQIWLQTVQQIGEAFGLGVHEFLAPGMPLETHLPRKVAPSRVHKGLK